MVDNETGTDGGALAAEVLARHHLPFLFTLCGGHISPLLVAAKRRGIKVVDTRHEATAVFAADAVARLSGRPGVAAVTAGPGLTNAITAVKNAQLAQSPLVLIGGATATMLRGRGALQDIDQAALMAPHVKAVLQAQRRREIVPLLEDALSIARHGVPGPVFLELPVDLLYPEATVREWYFGTGGGGKGIRGKVVKAYLGWHLRRLFAAGRGTSARKSEAPPFALPAGRLQLRKAAKMLARAQRPVLVLGSQATLDADGITTLAAAVRAIGAPTYLSGMARGLLGANDPLLLRHGRRQALKQADLVLLAGVPFDFRLGYGRQIPGRTPVVAINLDREDLELNRHPRLAIEADPGETVRHLARLRPERRRGDWSAWLAACRARDEERETEIDRLASEEQPDGVNPLALCRALDQELAEDSVLVADGGDFVATASYVVAPRGPLRWLDPGVFGTLGVGAGFALGAKLCRPEAEVWLLYGDGSCAYSLAEIDTFVRHGLGVIAVVGNDAGWTQIAREQVEVLGDAVGTELLPTAYHEVAEGYGGTGLEVRSLTGFKAAVAAAKQEAAAGNPVLINAHLVASDFRKGSISI